jgi:hypothetical protein
MRGVTVSAFPKYSLADANVVALSVGCGYVNEPCVTVTVCKPGTNDCQTIPNVLLDTGSFGLRIFNTSLVQALNLTQVSNGGGTLAECQTYLDNSSDWGPIANADVSIGGETASNIRIQLIDANFNASHRPSNCLNPDNDTQVTKFNGILGVGVFVTDCGVGCSLDGVDNQTYFSCNSAGCNVVSVPEVDQVSNPVAQFSQDNNGLIVDLPAVPAAGVFAANGYLVFGIGTQTNNIPDSELTVINTDGNGDFQTVFNGNVYPASFIDSGSNGLYFPSIPQLPICPVGAATGFFCPSSLLNFTAVNSDSNSKSTVNFRILSGQVAFAEGSPNKVFDDIGAPNAGGFDFGLPFFLGKIVYVGFNGKSSNLATDGYFAY